MTLICTVISDFGIIQASDSNLTSERNSAGTGRKVFVLSFARGALSMAGCYSIDGRSMELWMPNWLQAYRTINRPTLECFAHHLRQRFNSEMTVDERRLGSLIHIAGYATDSTREKHPEMWFVRNFDRINESTGAYRDPNDQFDVSEDFWNRGYLTDATRSAIRAGGSQRYFNGFPPERIAFGGLTQFLAAFFRQVWDHPNWRFRPPRTLDELASFVKLEMYAVTTIFMSSDYSAPFIGGAHSGCEDCTSRRNRNAVEGTVLRVLSMRSTMAWRSARADSVATQLGTGPTIRPAFSNVP
jgi:hypothetical protein